jgi:hypothetical protein
MASKKTNKGVRLVLAMALLGVVLLVALWWMTRRAQQLEHPKDNAVMAAAAQAIGPNAMPAGQDADLTGDGKAEWVFTVPAQTSAANARWVKALAIVWMPKKKPMSVLAIGPKGIMGKDAAVLLVKPDAPHGYLYELDAATRQVNVCIADANGKPAGDWIAFVWDDVQQRFGVANP